MCIVALKQRAYRISYLMMICAYCLLIRTCWKTTCKHVGSRLQFSKW